MVTSTLKLSQKFESHNLLTFIGTGGVGKTSLSVVTAIQAAKSGRRVAAITIDPSRRLTHLLGMDLNSQQDFQSIQWDDMSGSLDIYYVDPETVFQQFVSSHLSSQLYDKLKSNGIYRQISKNLRETHNFAALYKMVEIFKKDEYDLVVLDTPPCDQVIEFFESPSRLQKFFSNQGEDEKKTWVDWIQNKSLKFAESFIKKLVGGEFVDEMNGFFSAVGSLKSEIALVTEEFLVRMQKESSYLFLVYPPSLDKVSDARYLMREMSKNNFFVNEFVMNRAYLKVLDQSQEPGLSGDSEELKLYNYFVEMKARSLSQIEQLREELEGYSLNFSLLPEIEANMQSLNDILSFAQKMDENWIVT